LLTAATATSARDLARINAAEVSRIGRAALPAGPVMSAPGRRRPIVLERVIGLELAADLVAQTEAILATDLAATASRRTSAIDLGSVAGPIVVIVQVQVIDQAFRTVPLSELDLELAIDQELVIVLE
jgi:hypothetical protein